MVEKIPSRRKWQPTPVFLPGKSHGQRSLVGYSPWGHRESDTPEQLSIHAPIFKAGIEIQVWRQYMWIQEGKGSVG